MQCFKCGAQGHQRRNFPVREAESEAKQEQQEENSGGKAADDQGEQGGETKQPEITLVLEETSKPRVESVHEASKKNNLANSGEDTEFTKHNYLIDYRTKTGSDTEHGFTFLIFFRTRGFTEHSDTSSTILLLCCSPDPELSQPLHSW
ncbi:UNVERIFIED_CONTAM: hypothetical protein FKN15_029658 [Acipenser sinensis]